IGTGSTQITASQAGDANYSAADDISFTITVNKKDLTVRADDLSKTYDGVPYSGGNGVSYSGFVLGEDESVLSGTLSYSGDSQGATDEGSYQIIPSGFIASNYNLDYVAGTLSIIRSGDNVLTFNSQIAGSVVSLTYGSSGISAGAAASSGLPVSYSSSNSAVA